MEWIYNGKVGNTPYSVRRLSSNDIGFVGQLQEKVIDELEDMHTLQPLSEGELKFLVEGHGLIIGAFVEEYLIAFRALLIPENDHENLGRDVGILEEQLDRIIYQEISCVDPDFRGFGLQRELAGVVMNEVDTSLYDYVCATVMPFNIASLKDKFSQGMHIGALKYKYGGKLRYVFCKKLTTTRKLLPLESTVLMSDIEGQQALLKDGFVGIKMRLDGDEWVVDYKKVAD